MSISPRRHSGRVRSALGMLVIAARSERAAATTASLPRINSQEEDHHSRNQRYCPGFRSGDHRRQDPLPRLDRQQLDGAVLAPEGFHAGVYHRARYMAKIKPEFDTRGVKIIGLSVDPLASHRGWLTDIQETQGFAPNYPMIADSDFKVSKLYGMLPAA